MTGQRIGYKRVSTVDQNTMRQLEGVVMDEVFEDKASGKSTAQRPALEAMLKHVRKGDVVICHSMDRLARNLDDLRGIVLGLTNRGVRVEFVQEGLSFTGEDSALSKLLLSVMGAFAEFERSLIMERQREGVAIAKAAGKYKGRKPLLSIAIQTGFASSSCSRRAYIPAGARIWNQSRDSLSVSAEGE